MKLEEQVVSRELSGEMKKAGYKQEEYKKGECGDGGGDREFTL